MARIPSRFTKPSPARNAFPGNFTDGFGAEAFRYDDQEPGTVPFGVAGSLPESRCRAPLVRLPAQTGPQPRGKTTTRTVIRALTRMGEKAEARRLAQSIQAQTGLAIPAKEMDRLLNMLR